MFYRMIRQIAPTRMRTKPYVKFGEKILRGVLVMYWCGLLREGMTCGVGDHVVVGPWVTM